VGVEKTASIQQIMCFPRPLIPSRKGRGKQLLGTLKEAFFISLLRKEIGVRRAKHMRSR